MIKTFYFGHNFIFDILHEDCNPTKDYREQIHDMSVIKSWNKYDGPDFNNLVLYILFVYDQSSPFIRKYPNYEDRKKQALLEAGFDDVSKEDNKKFQEIIQNKNEDVVEMIVDFLKYQDNKLWTTICTQEELFLEYTKTLMKSIDLISNDKDLIAATNTKEKLREAQSKVREDLKGLYEEFYNNDKTLEESSKGKKISPEYFAKRNS